MIKIKWLAILLRKSVRKRLASAPNFVIGDPANPYLLRWYIIPRNRFFNIYLHTILRSDDDRALHDHPWWNVSFVLDGQMAEVLPGPFFRRLEQGELVFRKAEAAHRLELIGKRSCITLFLTGPRIREWGFHCPQGWRHWKIFTSFDETGNSTQIGRGCGEL